MNVVIEDVVIVDMPPLGNRSTACFEAIKKIELCPRLFQNITSRLDRPPRITTGEVVAGIVAQLNTTEQNQIAPISQDHLTYLQTHFPTTPKIVILNKGLDGNTVGQWLKQNKIGAIITPHYTSFEEVVENLKHAIEAA